VHQGELGTSGSSQLVFDVSLLSFGGILDGPASGLVMVEGRLNAPLPLPFLFSVSFVAAQFASFQWYHASSGGQG